jgi:hypothetical protein
MDLERLKEIYIQEEQHSFKGWDFSHINNRMREEELPWDYRKIAAIFNRQCSIKIR